MDSDSLVAYLVAVLGFILLHTAQCQPKNSTSIVIANLLSIAVSTIMFYSCGFAFAIGEHNRMNSNFFLSYSRFFLIDAHGQDYRQFSNELFQLFLVIVISNSGFICRMKHWLYPVIAVVISGFTYPFVRHWTYHDNGWLKKGISTDEGTISLMHDHGSVLIHIFAGGVSLVGTILLSPRIARTRKGFSPLEGKVTPLMFVGGFLAYYGLVSIEIEKSTANRMIASQCSAIVAYISHQLRVPGNHSATKALINGALAGLVGVACFPDRYYSYLSLVIGLISGITFISWNCLLHLCRVDDPTQSVSIHLGCGLWAMLAGPLFLPTKGVLHATNKLSYQIFGWYLMAGVTIFVWAGMTTFIILLSFVVTKIAKHKSPMVSDVGLDLIEHNEPAYPERYTYTQEESDGVSNIAYIPNKPANDNTSFHFEDRNYREWKAAISQYK